VDEIPSLAKGMRDTIIENYMVGGYMRAENVHALREGFEWACDRVLAAANREGYMDVCRIALQKITEAIADAERRGHGFVEATEVYSGILGQNN